MDTRKVTVAEVRKVIQLHRGRVMMDALVKDDTWSVQVFKADVFANLRLYEPADVSPIYTDVRDGDLYLHRNY